MYAFVELLRAVAVLLITNSHFDGVYPWNISWGGCPGVALFFVITGFLLKKSVGKGNPFFWWLKKVIRLYIPLTIVNSITILIGFRKADVMLFLFPINYNLWFVPVLTALYILYYFVVSIDNKISKNGVFCKWSRLTAIIVCVAAYAVVYYVRYRNEFFVEPEVWFRAIYGFIAMLLGSIVYDIKDKIEKLRHGYPFIVLSVLFCAAFLGAKFFMNRFDILLKLQFITQVSGVGFAFFAIVSGVYFEKQISRFMKTLLGKATGLISKCSLEIYLVQFSVIYYLKFLVFPLNFVLICIVTVLCAFAVHFVSDKLSKTITKHIL